MGYVNSPCQKNLQRAGTLLVCSVNCQLHLYLGPAPCSFLLQMNARLCSGVITRIFPSSPAAAPAAWCAISPAERGAAPAAEFPKPPEPFPDPCLLLGRQPSEFL